MSYSIIVNLAEYMHFCGWWILKESKEVEKAPAVIIFFKMVDVNIMFE